MVKDHILLSAFWIAYCVMHSVLADQTLKKWIRKAMGRHYKIYRAIYTIIFFILLVLILWFQIHMYSTKVFEPLLFIYIIGAVLALSGLSLMLYCIRKYFFSLSGLKSLLIENVSNELIISDVHKLVRHPLYLGTFAFIWGLFLIFPYWSVLLPNIIITIYTLIGINLEEQKLIAEFGEQYKTYRQKVPKLIPSLKAKRYS